ncbi:hypothetical protein MBLNU457_6829t1 [Dothideomycetes sp. NU457]
MNDFSHANLPIESNTIPDPGVPQILLYPDEAAALQDELSDDDVKELDSQGTHLEDATKRDSAVDAPVHAPVNASANSPPRDDNEKHKHSARRRIKSIGHGAKVKSKHLLTSARARVGIVEPTPSDSPYADLDNNPAFEPAHLVGNRMVTVGGAADKILDTIHATGKIIADPRHAAKKKVASKLAVEDRPYLPRDADMEYLEAHDDLSRAESYEDDKDDVDDDGMASRDVERTQQRVEQLDDIRDGRKVAWLTSKHIHRVMVVPKREPVPPKKDNFYVIDPETGERKLDWYSYSSENTRYFMKSFAIDHMGDIEPAGASPFSKEVVLRYIERILISSSPWQSWFRNIRSIYRWDNPTKTMIWGGVWLVIWYFNCCITFILCYVVYIVLNNKYNRKNVDNMRESYDRADSNESTYRFNELIQKYGDEHWIDPLLEEMGPLLQLQLSDTADFFEILNNFYDWRTPDKTWATLFWFFTAIAIGLLTPTAYTMKIIWMFCWLSVFLGRPIASKHRQYRHVVNALKWIFWEIPNDADWAMMYLRRKAQETRARLIGDKVERQWEEQAQIMSLPVVTKDVPGYSRTYPVDDPRPRDPDYDSDGDSIASFATAASTTSLLGQTDLVSFYCRYKGIPGRVIIYSDGLRFVRSSHLTGPRKELWRHDWNTLMEVRKTNFSTMAKVVSKEGIDLIVKSDAPRNQRRIFHLHQEHDRNTPRHHNDNDMDHNDDMDNEVAEQHERIKLEGIKGRDRAFNCIIGFSGLKFHVLQPLNEAKNHQGATKLERVQDRLGIHKKKNQDNGREMEDEFETGEIRHGEVDLKSHGGANKGWFD